MKKIKKIIVVLLSLCLAYLSYSCLDASSQIKKLTVTNDSISFTQDTNVIILNKTVTIDTLFAIIDSTNYTIIIQKKPTKQIADSNIIKLQSKNDSVINELQKNTVQLKQQNQIIDSMIKRNKK